MNLVLDFGNTDAKVAVFEENNLLWTERFTYSDSESLLERISEQEFDKVGVSKVNDPNESWKDFLSSQESKLFYLNNVLDQIQFKSHYQTLETLGDDRVCNVLAAHYLFPNENCLVIDLGTCNKYDFVDKDGIYHGGAIAPGFEMRAKSMHHFTHQLPLIELESKSALIGDSSIASMKSGNFNGMLGEINHFITQYKSRFPDIKIVLTGGFMVYFEKELKNHIFADSYLTLRGMNLILNILD